MTAAVVDGVVIARLKEVRPAVANTAEGAYTQMADAFKTAIGTDLMEAMSRAFAKRYPLEINNTIVDDTISRQR